MARLVWTEAGTSDIRIKLPLLIGAGIIVGGSFASGALFFLLNLAHTKALSKNTEDLHGSARWATKADIEETSLIQARRGVYVGGWYEQSIKHLHYLRHNGPEHILAFAPTRSGKGVGIVIPTLLAWAESTVVYDIKGENWAKTAGFRSQSGQVCFKFAPVEPDQSSRFNPLSEIRLFTERDVSDAQNIADMLVRSDEDKPEDRYWQEAAASITTGMILHACYAALLEVVKLPSVFSAASLRGPALPSAKLSPSFSPTRMTKTTHITGGFPPAKRHARIRS